MDETQSLTKEVVMESNGRGSRLPRRALIAGALALVLVGVLALTVHARGWRGDGRQPSPDRQAARMAERLGLSAEQQAQVQKILTESMAKRREIREEGRKKMEGLRQETETRFSAVLTPEQMGKLREFREQRRDRRGDCVPRAGGRGGNSPGGPPPAAE
jgi:Spy/CpxP family protein refolding chaperone